MKYLSLILIVCITSFFSINSQAEWVLLGHTSVEKESLDTRELKRLFFGRISQWDGGEPVKLCFLNDSNALVEYLGESTKYSKKRFLAYWNSRLFSGGNIAPKQFRSSEDLLDYVARTRGAICIADPKAVPEGFSGKVIRIK